MLDSIKLWWIWRRKAHRAMARSLFLALLAFAFTVTGLVTSIFSSFVVTSSNLEVLVSSPYCKTNPTDFDWGTFQDVTQTYTRECYGKAPPLPASCNVLVRPNIQFASSRVSCPFDQSFCKANLPAIEFDSGLLDVAQTFGLNVGEEDAVKIRKKTTCAIMDLANHTVVEKSSNLPTGLVGHDIDPDDNVLMLNYGPTISSQNTILRNSTWYLSLRESNATTDIKVEYVHNTQFFFDSKTWKLSINKIYVNVLR